MQLRGDLKNDNLIILLHGYGQSAEVALRLFNKYLPEEFSVLAIEGTYPVEMETNSGIVKGFAWYLFDRKKQVFITPMAEAVDIVVDQINTLALAPKNLILVGYSQGGYMAPFVGQRLDNVKKVIGLNSRVRCEELRGEDLEFVLDGIHGERDLVVDPKNSQNCHKKILSTGGRGEFTLVPRSGHKFDRALGKALKTQIVKVD